MSLRGWKFRFDVLRYVHGHLHPPPWKFSDKCQHHHHDHHHHHHHHHHHPHHHHHHHHHHHQPAVPFFGLVKYDHPEKGNGPAVPAGLVSNWNVAFVVLRTLEIAIHQQKSGPNRIWLEQKRVSMPPKTNMEPKTGGLEDDVPFQTGDFQVQWQFSEIYMN